MLIAAAAAEWNVPASECSAAKRRHHPPAVRTHHDLRQGGDGGRATMPPPAEVTLKDPKDWKIAGKPLPRLDTADKLTGKQVYGTDLKLPGMLNATDPGLPVLRRQGGAASTPRRSRGCRASSKVVRVDDTAVAVVADTWWQAKTALDALPIDWDEGPNTGLSSAVIAEMLKEGLDAQEAFVGNQVGRCTRRRWPAPARRSTARLCLPLSEPRHHGADERHGALDRRTSARCGCRRRTARAASPPRRRPPACRCSSARSTSCISAAASAGAAFPGLRAPGRAPSPRRCRARRSS